MFRVPDPLSFDPIAEAHRQWSGRWPEHAERMAAVTSIMRVHQLLLAEVERALKPHHLTFASYEALRLLAFSRAGELPMGKMGERLMVHPASMTNTVDRLERQGLVRRHPAAEDRRRILAEITPAGRDLAETATAALHGALFGLGALDAAEAVVLTRLLRRVRAAAGDFAEESHDPWRP